MTTHYMPDEALLELLKRPGEVPTIVPTETKRLGWLAQVGEDVSLSPLLAPRSAQSPKGFFLPPAESMGRYGLDGPAATVVETTERVLVGVRACELRARNYLDKVMLSGDIKDPPYQARREAGLIVSCDCVDCTDSCFCTLVGGEPFAREGFDVNLTPIGGGFVVEVAGERGGKWVGAGEAGGPAEASAEQLSERGGIRQEMTERVRKQNESFDFAASDEDAPPLPKDGDECWQKFAADCVECGACTHICPTCHCFYLYDQVLGADQFERVRTWDSCLLSTYHRMAGGVHMKLSPRPKLFSRLANRVLHKFAYSGEQYHLLGCVGCGRCIDACLGDIDIRQVVQELGR